MSKATSTRAYRAVVWAGLLLTASLLTPLANAQEPMPDVIHGPPWQGLTAPIWVSAAAATTPDGSLDWAQLHNFRETRLRRYVADFDAWRQGRAGPTTPETSQAPEPQSSTTTQDCPYYFGRPTYGPGKPPDLEAAVRQAIAIIRGEVVATSQGFELGHPGTLLKVRPTTVLRSSDALAALPAFFVFFPEATFTIGNTTFCSCADELPSIPEVGDSVLVLPPNPPRDINHSLVWAYPEWFFVQSPGGTLRLPRAQGHTVVPSRVSNLDELFEAVRSIDHPIEHGREAAAPPR